MAIGIGAALAVLGPLAKLFLPKIIPSIDGIIESYAKKEISKAERDARIADSVMKAFSEIEVSHSETLAQTFQAFMGVMKESKLVKLAWFIVTMSQLCVLLWHQIGIPAYVHITGNGYPSSGATVEWAYLLLGFCLGGGPLIMRGGPGAGNIASRIKSMIPG